MAIFQAIKNAGSTDPVKLKGAMKSLNMDSLIGNITFNSKGDLQNQRAHLRLFQVKDGNFVPVQ